VQVNNRTIASAATVNLGVLGRGSQTLGVTPLDGPQAIWTVGIHAVPVALTGPTFNVTAAQPGATLTARYTVTADGTMTASIVSPNGSVQRPLATGLPVAAGSHSLTWDGLDPTSGVRSAGLSLSGRLVARRGPRGRIVYRPRRGWAAHRRYRFTVTAKDRVGNLRRFTGSFSVR
jgi:hypothetical protein